METNSENTTTSDKDEPDREYDLVLDVLLAIKNDPDSEDDSPPISIILQMGGWLVTGYIISQKEYLEGFMFGELNKGLNRAIEVLKEKGEWSEEKDKNVERLPRFIHLKGAKFYQPGQPAIPGNEGVLWRGRIDAIDGYVYGALATEIRQT
jgi:hypothetical protein